MTSQRLSVESFFFFFLRQESYVHITSMEHFQPGITMVEKRNEKIYLKPKVSLKLFLLTQFWKED